ncbi:MAG TPA: 3-hydroxybutyrate dehydrogenase [Alphaproteobacteria bacterium]
MPFSGVVLDGKVALVTGSTSGIGLGIAKALAEQGAHIMLNGLGSDEQIAQAKAEISQAGHKVSFHPADLTKPDQIAALIASTIENFGRIDILVNNAGIQHVAALDEFPPEKWEQIIQLNLVAAFHTLRLAIPYMKKQGWGRVINMASAHALVASPFKSAYVAAKHGLAGLTKTLALEVAQQNITVNAICPGYVKTPLVENQIADQAKARGITEEEVIKNVLLAAQPTKKFTTVEQVAGLAIFLCSDAADNITGSLQSIDGGWTAQ